jgi:hypothetical protein
MLDPHVSEVARELTVRLNAAQRQSASRALSA